ncbi:hypothetical protein F4677DRAFT_345551 [Hypoxylon crocopeplum]|nr:hypothetical protein F4677DRAFT_345551 [Hypoxylon crocopeplum]
MATGSSHHVDTSLHFPLLLLSTFYLLLFLSGPCPARLLTPGACLRLLTFHRRPSLSHPSLLTSTADAKHLTKLSTSSNNGENCRQFLTLHYI